MISSDLYGQILFLFPCKYNNHVHFKEQIESILQPSNSYSKKRGEHQQPLELQSGIMRQANASWLLTSVDLSATEYIDVFDITSKLFFTLCQLF